MPLIAAKCTQCGANIEIDNAKEAGICQYCGTAFITEKAITNYNTYITNNLAGANINITGVNVDNLLTLAKNAEEINNYAEAKDYYTRVLENQPDHCEALVGKGICSLYESNLNDIKSEESIRYISKAIDYKRKEQNINEGDVDKFIINSAKKLYQATTTVLLISQTHYNEYWKFEDAAPEYWNRLIKIISIFQYIIKLTEPDNIQQTPDGKFHHLEGMKFVVMCCVEICKQRQYVSGIINPGQFLETEEKREIKPIACTHQIYMNLYDDMCSKIRKIEPTYQPSETINRNTEIQGGCYIATCVYGSYDCPEVWTLRRFRDYYLMRKFWGKIFVKIYYKTSPTIVKIFGNQTAFKRFWMYWLDKFIDNLKTRGYEDTNYYGN